LWCDEAISRSRGHVQAEGLVWRARDCFVAPQTDWLLAMTAPDVGISPVRHSQHGFGESGALDLNPGRRGLDLAEIVGGQLD